MIIREAQRQEFAKQSQKKFEDKMVVHLNKAFTEEAKNWQEEDLREFIRRGMQKAFSYKIEIEADVSRFIEYMFCYGENFDTSEKLEWFQPVLNSEELDGTQKMDAVDRLNYIALTSDD